MATIDNCGTSGLQDVKSTNCALNGVTKKVAWTTRAFRFNSEADARQLTNWNTGIAGSDIYPFPIIEGVEAQDVEAVVQQFMVTEVRTDVEKKKTRFTILASDCVYAKIKSFDNQYLLIYEFLDGDIFKCITQSDGKVKGQEVYIKVSNPTTATVSEASVVYVDVSYLSPREYIDSPTNLKLDSSYSSVEGAAAVQLDEALTSTALLLNIDVTLSCGGDKVIDLIAADFILKDAAGVTVVPTSITYNATTEVYEVVGTGFANGFTLELVPKITPELIYKGYNVLTIANV